MRALIIAEHDNQQLKSSTLNTITAAQALADTVVVLVAGAHCQAVADAVAQVAGVSEVLLSEAPHYAHPIAEQLAPLVVAVTQATPTDYVLAPATTFGKNLLPRVAALLDVAPISDVIEIKNANTFVRPIYAGNALATVQTEESCQLLTIRTTAFAPAANSGSMAPITPQAATEASPLAQLVSQSLTQSNRPELSSARVVISGGRGMGNGDNFRLLERIADQLGAAIGASRAAVDAGFVPNDYQVGQTGKIVAPDLYIAVGISGAIQHLAGMKDSKVIVAINKDEEAAIFQVADYGLVGDLFTILPELAEALQQA